MTNSNHTSISISTGTMIRAILVLVAVFLFWFLLDLFFVVLTAIVIASFIESIAPYFKRMRINRVFGIVATYTISLLIFAGLFYLFVPLLITEIYNFSNFISAYVPGVSFFDFFQNEEFSGAKDILKSLEGNLSLTSLFSVSQAFILNLSGGFFQTISIAFGGAFNFILIIVISFYLSIQEKGIEDFLRLVAPIKHEDYVLDLWERSRNKIALWVKGQVVLGLVVGILTYLVLSLLGVDYALLLAVIAGVMDIIPYGTIIALIPIASFSFFSGGLYDALLVTGAYVIINQFEVFLFAPIIIKKIVGLSPIVIILSILAGFQLGGVWGVILALPVAIIFMEFLSDLEKNKILVRTQSK